MFNNIIYFIIVLLLFNVSYYVDEGQVKSFAYSLSMFFISWIMLGVFCRIGFNRLIKIFEEGKGTSLANSYNSLVLRLSITAIFILSFDVFVFNIKYWIESVPVIGGVYIFQGLSGILLFLLYLSTIWYFAHPAYAIIFNSDVKRSSFVAGSIKLNIPLIFPWLFLSLAFETVSLSPWPALNRFVDTIIGQILFFSIVLIIIMIYLPILIQYFWGCRPVGRSEKADTLREYLDNIGLKYRNLVNWPVFGGKMMTAGIMGVIPRYRYILISDSLMDILSISELKSVMAHEAGHAKYNHQLLYALFFLGYFVLAIGFLKLGYLIISIFHLDISANLYIAVPMLLSLIIYFRYIMGFFMRHFERQADIYSSLLLDDPSPIISSLEKIALFSGKIREVPSWHHFSIKQRVEFLEKSRRDPGMIRDHGRMLKGAFLVYAIVTLSLIYFLYFTPVKNIPGFSLLNSIIWAQVEENQHNIDLLENIAHIYHEMEKHEEAAAVYERILALDSNRLAVLNNFAWLLITTDNIKLRDPVRGLNLAKKAAAIKRTPFVLDTLAEAYWVNGNSEKAVRVIKEAIALDDTDSTYYRDQLEKFLKKKDHL